ncbi:GNAT family N-acetyltransferase [Dyella sp. C9]|uniref:GNAT family N-acetyltransferase n=1 Tax=Dyella sp. C9 TaxID=2202154 RepID=UPI000DEF6C98|nr:GNAT family protein [Dyella sp. C9]
MELATERLLLDALTLEDAPALFGYRGDPDVWRYQNWRPESLAEVERFIRKQSALDAPVVGQWFQRAIRLRREGSLVGDLAFCLSEDGQAEFGITIAPPQQGRGLAREAATALLGALFGTFGMHRVRASVDPRNLSSMALMRSLGLRQEAHMRECLKFRGEWVDDVIFALLAREWPINVAADTADVATR